MDLVCGFMVLRFAICAFAGRFTEVNDGSVAHYPDLDNEHYLSQR